MKRKKKLKTSRLPVLRVPEGSPEEIKREAKREGITAAAYIRQCIWQSRKRLGYLKSAEVELR